MAILADSSPLISLVRIGRFDLLKKLYKKVFIPPSVYEEVVIEGKRLHKPGIREIEKAIDSGWINVMPLTKSESENASEYHVSGVMGRGESEVIALAKRRKLPIIMDDRYARELAEAIGLEFQGTGAVLLEGYLYKILSKREFMEAITELGKVMWLSPEVITELIRQTEVDKK